jgi:hypothetical protein
MVVAGKDVPDEIALLIGKSLRPGTCAQVLAELLFRRQRDGHSRKRHGYLHYGSVAENSLPRGALFSASSVWRLYGGG